MKFLSEKLAHECFGITKEQVNNMSETEKEIFNQLVESFKKDFDEELVKLMLEEAKKLDQSDKQEK